MDLNCRYNLQHLGDIFVGALQKTTDVLLSCPRGAILAYEINVLQNKQQKVCREIGARISLLMREETTDVAADAPLSALFVTRDNIEKNLAAHEKHRSALSCLFNVQKAVHERPTVTDAA
jgi:hypothetical protein